MAALPLPAGALDHPLDQERRRRPLRPAGLVQARQEHLLTGN
ncbi:hypothetical protein ACFTXM_48410 [Streptomyces sp. NPDC056930]